MAKSLPERRSPWWQALVAQLRKQYRRAIKFSYDRPQLSRHLLRPLDIINDIRLLRRLLREYDIDCVFDVGANTGQYGDLLRRCVGYKGRIISFEPNPVAFAALRRRVAADPLWQVENIALSDQEGELQLNVMHADLFSSLHAPTDKDTKLYVGANEVARQVPVVVKTLASVLPPLQGALKFERPFLKMDTQGHDAAVVRGAGEHLPRFVGLQSELSIVKLYEGTLDYVETVKLYESLGYVVCAFMPNNRGVFPTAIEMDCLMLRRDLLTR
jgi:FkbM family methyltransferase